MKNVEKQLDEFMKEADVDGSAALEGLVKKLSIDNIIGILETLELNKGGTTDKKLDKVASQLFGPEMKKVEQAMDNYAGVVESGQTLVQYAFSKANTAMGYNIGDLKEMLAKVKNFKLGQVRFNF